MSHNRQSLNSEYSRLAAGTGDIDERMFVDKVDEIGTPTKIASQTRNYYQFTPSAPPPLRITDDPPASEHSVCVLTSVYNHNKMNTIALFYSAV